MANKILFDSIREDIKDTHIKDIEFPVQAGTSRYDSNDYAYSLYFEQKIRTKDFCNVEDVFEKLNHMIKSVDEQKLMSELDF